MGLFSALCGVSPKTIEQLDAECGSEITRSNYQKAARIAFKFRNYAAKDSHFDEAEKLVRVANAYYWLCKATFKQIETASKDHLYELLVAFFAAHKMGTYFFQKILFKVEGLVWNEQHPMYPRHEELNKLYDRVYQIHPEDITKRADFEANKKTPL